MPHWDAKRHRDDEQRRIEQRAANDARKWAKRIWRDGIPGGLVGPIAVRATYDYIDQLRQESTSIPRWAWASQEAMRGYIQMVGDRYYEKFYDVLCTTIGRAIKPYGAIPHSTPLPAHFPDMVTPMLDEYETGIGDDDRRDWSGSHPTQEGAS